MKNLRMILPVVLLMTVLSGSAFAQTKIATVDLKKLFDGYWKTKQAQSVINDRRVQLQKDDKSMQDDLTKSAKEYQQLLDQASDPAISDDERSRRNQAAANKQKQLQSSKAAIDQFERTAQSQLAEQFQRMREGILTDLKAAVVSKAKTSGYDLVLDSAAETANGTTVLVYSSGANDITEAVLAQINAGAPIDVTSPASAPATNSATTP
jgi:outer membrane protein